MIFRTKKIFSNGLDKEKEMPAEVTEPTEENNEIESIDETNQNINENEKVN